MRYRTALEQTPHAELDPDVALTDIIAWVRKKAGTDPKAKRHGELLIKRLKRIREEVDTLARKRVKGRSAAAETLPRALPAPSSLSPRGDNEPE